MRLKAAGQAKISNMAKIEGAFLESVLPVQALAVLTTRVQASQHQFDGYIRQWVREEQEHHGMTLGYLRAYEYVPLRHAHVVLIASAPLDCLHVQKSWQAIAAPRSRRAAVVWRHRSGLCGAEYAIKSLESPVEEIEFSPNVAYFGMGNRRSLFSTKPAQRRQHRRINAQMKQHSDCVLPPNLKIRWPVIPPEWLVSDADK
jgi:hypothetical protein